MIRNLNYILIHFADDSLLQKINFFDENCQFFFLPPFFFLYSAQAVATFQSKYSDIFPNKNCLILKIREVRQKVHQNTPNTPGGIPSSPNPSAAAAAAAASHGSSAPPPPQLTHNNHHSMFKRNLFLLRVQIWNPLIYIIKYLLFSC